MKLTAKGTKFEPCPDYTGRAVCVDVTPLKRQEGKYGIKEIFRVVFEVDLPKEGNGRWCVWSNGFTPNLGERANFRKFLKQWFGRDLTAEEENGLDTETLIGKPASLVVIHNTTEN